MGPTCPTTDRPRRAGRRPVITGQSRSRRGRPRPKARDRPPRRVARRRHGARAPRLTRPDGRAPRRGPRNQRPEAAHAQGLANLRQRPRPHANQSPAKTRAPVSCLRWPSSNSCLPRRVKPLRIATPGSAA
ncbi:UNVERIFIED_CONTAM: hypothetical protein GTU68_030550 [Idotea baltica]|nr:hypothetical protein [Idotea baltica]